MDPREVEHLETLALDASNKTISAIECLLAAWEGAAEKPEDFEQDVLRYKYVLDSLANWEQRMLKSRGRAEMDERLEILRQFSLIFNSYK